MELKTGTDFKEAGCQDVKASGFLAQCPLLGSKYLIIKKKKIAKPLSCTIMCFGVERIKLKHIQNWNSRGWSI